MTSSSQALLEDAVESQAEALRLVWLLLSAFCVFLMQLGFALLETGSVRAKNARSVLFKNFLDALVGVFAWWLVGFGLAGGGASSQTGRNFAGVEEANATPFVHSYTFAITTVTIVSGGIAERMTFNAYMSISFVSMALTYPVLADWAWAGWLNELGYSDFGGGGVVHVTGAAVSAVSAKLVGPRVGRFLVELLEDPKTGARTPIKRVKTFKGHSSSLQAIGVLILMWGFFFFNCSSTLGATEQEMRTSGKVAVVTLVAMSGAGLLSLAYSGCKHGLHDLGLLMNCILCGAVSSCAGCNSLHQCSAFLMGGLASLLYPGAAWVVAHKLGIDDPLDTIAVHGLSGGLGVLWVGLFSKTGGLLTTGSAKLLVAQVAGLATIVAWSTACTWLAFALLKVGRVNIRVSHEAEVLGLDFAFHDGFEEPQMDKGDVLDHNLKKRAQAQVKAAKSTKQAAETSANGEPARPTMMFGRRGLATWGEVMQQQSARSRPSRSSQNATASMTRIIPVDDEEDAPDTADAAGATAAAAAAAEGNATNDPKVGGGAVPTPAVPAAASWASAAEGSRQLLEPPSASAAAEGSLRLLDVP